MQIMFIRESAVVRGGDMAGTTYARTIDWDEYWRTADEQDRENASASADYVVEPLLELFADRGVPDTYADVGCGSGATVFTVADEHPGTAVVGYDAAEPVLADGRERAREDGYANVSFGRTVLPQFNPDQQFDVVSSFFTLCYVADVERALENLYDAVAPGGYLVLTYHNRLAQRQFRTVAETPEQYLDESARFDPETYAQRFELVLEGESLLSHDRIHETLGTWPRSVWSVAETERYGAWRMNPLVFVPKEESTHVGSVTEDPE